MFSTTSDVYHIIPLPIQNSQFRQLLFHIWATAAFVSYSWLSLLLKTLWFIAPRSIFLQHYCGHICSKPLRILHYLLQQAQTHKLRGLCTALFPLPYLLLFFQIVPPTGLFNFFRYNIYTFLSLSLGACSFSPSIFSGKDILWKRQQILVRQSGLELQL